MADKYGAEDWSKYRPNVPRETLFDLAELAARLGSPVTYDRRGSAMFMDGFEGTLNSVRVTELAGVAIAQLDQTRAFRGHQCVSVFVASNSGSRVLVEKTLPLYAINNIGIEFHWAQGTGLTRFFIFVDYFAGASQWRGEIEIDITNNVINYRESPGVYVELVTASFSDPRPGQWYAAKLVVDTNSQEYVRFIHNNIETSLAGISLSESAFASDPGVTLGVSNTKNDIDDQTFYIDDMILTSDES